MIFEHVLARIVAFVLITCVMSLFPLMFCLLLGGSG